MPNIGFISIVHPSRRNVRDGGAGFGGAGSTGNGFGVRAAVARARDTARACRVACAIGHGRRARHTATRLRFSCDLTAARSQAKATFANTRWPRTVLFEHPEHTITPLEPSSRTFRTWFSSFPDLLEHHEHEYSRFIVIVLLELRCSIRTWRTRRFIRTSLFSCMEGFTNLGLSGLLQEAFPPLTLQRAHPVLRDRRVVAGRVHERSPSRLRRQHTPANQNEGNVKRAGFISFVVRGMSPGCQIRMQKAELKATPPCLEKPGHLVFFSIL